MYLRHEQIRLPTFINFATEIFNKSYVAGTTSRFQELHSRFFGRAVALFGVALNTRRYEILPRIHAATRLWLHMVERHWGLHRAAILTTVCVAAHNVFA